MTDNSIDVSVAAVLRLIRERDEARAAIARVEALCADGVVGLSHGCTCSGDEHVEGSCRYGEAMAWSLNPDAVRAALRGDS